MKIPKQIQQIKEIGKSTKEKQSLISAGEAWQLWAILSERYSVLATSQVFLNYAKDNDFKLILDFGIKIIKKEITTLEKTMLDYGVPLPERPAVDVNTAFQPEIFTDKFIFERLYIGIRDFLPTFQIAYIQSGTEKIRDLFQKFLLSEIDIYDKLFTYYGKLKNWLPEPPRYQPLG